MVSQEAIEGVNPSHQDVPEIIVSYFITNWTFYAVPLTQWLHFQPLCGAIACHIKQCKLVENFVKTFPQLQKCESMSFVVVPLKFVTSVLKHSVYFEHFVVEWLGNTQKGDSFEWETLLFELDFEWLETRSWCTSFTQTELNGKNTYMTALKEELLKIWSIGRRGEIRIWMKARLFSLFKTGRATPTR